MERPVRIGGYLEKLEFDYTNYKGEINHRKVIVYDIRYSNNEWHTELQWIMYAFDIEKKEFREFAMKDMHNVTDHD